MLRVLTLSSLFPDATRPNFGVFVERQTLGLAALRDVAVQVVVPIGLPPIRFGRHAKLAHLPSRETWKGLEVHRPRFTAIPATQGRYHAANLERALMPLLDGLDFDVIDASFFFPDGVAAAVLGKRYGVPVSIKARGSDIHHWGRNSATAAQVLSAGRAADGLLAVSRAMRIDMIALGMPADRIAVHSTGVDQDRFVIADRAAAKAALGVSGPLVVSLGALIARKRHDIAIEAVAALPGVTLIVAGEGPECGALQALAEKRGVADRIRLAGSVPHADLPGLLAAADVMALASSSEGLANAWVESLACGTPIVITEAGGAREVVMNPAAGRIAIADGLAFAAAIADILRDPPARAETRKAAARFTWDANAAALRAHLSALVDHFGDAGFHAAA